MCPDNSFPTEEDKGPYAYAGTWMCQACNSSIGAQPWTIAQWIFSTKPNIFGLIPGTANPTGVALRTILMEIRFFCPAAKGRFTVKMRLALLELRQTGSCISELESASSATVTSNDNSCKLHELTHSLCQLLHSLGKVGHPSSYRAGVGNLVPQISG